MELHNRMKPFGSLTKEVTYISEGSSSNDDDNSSSIVLYKDGANSSNGSLVSLEDEVSGSIRDMLVSKL